VRSKETREANAPGITRQDIDNTVVLSHTTPVPATGIRVFWLSAEDEDVDGRVKPGDDNRACDRSLAENPPAALDGFARSRITSRHPAGQQT
jgi:hypothetical protein